MKDTAFLLTFLSAYLLLVGAVLGIFLVILL
jgi:hypothetical protein